MVSIVERQALGRLGVNPGLAWPLLVQSSGRESLEAYRSIGGYSSLDDPESLLEEIEAAGLRGRGGGAFPFAVKVRTVRSQGQPPKVAANGEEGEPSSVKDRWLLRNRPHAVLDGVRLAARLVGADEAVVYVSDSASASSVRQAIAELDESSVSLGTPVRVFEVESAYVAGEESALVNAINGGPALPSEKPPRPFESGIGGRPTLISNVETLVNLPKIQNLGAVRYRAHGTETSPGTFLLTLTGVGEEGLYEVPFGITLRSLLVGLGEDCDDISGILMGGYFAGLLGTRALDIPLDYNSLRAAGSGLGCGAVGVVKSDSCLLSVAAGVLAYFARETAGQCGSCFNGTAAMSAVMTGLLDGAAGAEDVARLERWSKVLRGRGACGLLDGATNIAASAFTEFPGLIGQHLASDCTTCNAGGRPDHRPFAAIPPAS
jgi:NADH:ubiquinone oxidoreductase subunit F (NADH-binding)